MTARAAGLFTEDFDRPHLAAPPPPPPPPPAPPPPAEPDPEPIAAARLEAHAEGVQEGRAQAAQEREAAVCGLLASIAAQLDGAAAAVRAQGEENALQVARLVMARLHAAFPLLAARHGPAELAELARTLLPTLAAKPRVVVQVGPQGLPGIQAAMDRLDPVNTGSFELVEVADMPPCDIRLYWKDGRCVRDGGATWRKMAEILARHGMLDLPADDPDTPDLAAPNFVAPDLAAPDLAP